MSGRAVSQFPFFFVRAVAVRVLDRVREDELGRPLRFVRYVAFVASFATGRSTRSRGAGASRDEEGRIERRAPVDDVDETERLERRHFPPRPAMMRTRASSADVTPQSWSFAAMAARRNAPPKVGGLQRELEPGA